MGGLGEWGVSIEKRPTTSFRTIYMYIIMVYIAFEYVIATCIDLRR